MNSFDSLVFDHIRPLKCQVRIQQLEFNSSTKLDGKIAAGVKVCVNGSENYTISNLGRIKSKSGHYVWNENTEETDGPRMPHIKLDINESDEIVAIISLNQTKGIPLLTKREKEIHSYVVKILLSS